MAQISIRMDDKVKAQAEQLFESIGMSFSTAVNVFVRQAIRDGGIPFDINMKEDPFYSESNMQAIREALREANEGKLTAHELIED